MSKRRSSHRHLALQASEMAVAVPQVVAHRLARLATAGVTPSARDWQEFQLMGSEKLLAFVESWSAMNWEIFRVNQQLALGFMQSVWFPWLGANPLGMLAPRHLNKTALGIMQKGIEPVHRRAVANARRLGGKH